MQRNSKDMRHCVSSMGSIGGGVEGKPWEEWFRVVLPVCVDGVHNRVTMTWLVVSVRGVG